MFFIAKTASAVAVTVVTYTSRRISATSQGAFSQAHKENRVPRSGKPAGAIFMCGAAKAVS